MIVLTCAHTACSASHHRVCWCFISVPSWYNYLRTNGCMFSWYNYLKDKWLPYHVFLIQLSQGQMDGLSCLVIDLQIYGIFRASAYSSCWGNTFGQSKADIPRNWLQKHDNSQCFDPYDSIRFIFIQRNRLFWGSKSIKNRGMNWSAC